VDNKRHSQGSETDGEFIGDISNPDNLKKFETSKKYLEQIASDMDPSYLKVFARVFTWIVNNIL
jgi:hypothetical protein